MLERHVIFNMTLQCRITEFIVTWFQAFKFWLRSLFVDELPKPLPVTVSKSIDIRSKCGKHDCKNIADKRCVAQSCTEHCKWDCGSFGCLYIWRRQEEAALEIAAKRQMKHEDDAEEYLQ